MTEPRLAASVEASALMRRVTADGGFATILAKGDAERGSLLLIVTERGRHVAVLERMLNASGTYSWHAAALAMPWIARSTNGSENAAGAMKTYG